MEAEPTLVYMPALLAADRPQPYPYFSRGASPSRLLGTWVIPELPSTTIHTYRLIRL